MKSINFYLSSKKSYAEIEKERFELGKVSEIRVLTSEYEFSILYESNSDLHEAPLTLEKLIGHIGGNMEAVIKEGFEGKCGGSLGWLVKTPEAYGINIKYTD